MKKDDAILALAKELEKLAKEERYEELEKKLPSLEELASFMQSMISQAAVSDVSTFRKYDEQVLKDAKNDEGIRL